MWVEGGTGRGTFLFEPTHALGDVHCQEEVQVVEVNDGFPDLYVQHRGSCSALH